MLLVCFKKTTDALRQGCGHEAYDKTSKKEAGSSEKDTVASFCETN